MINKKTYRHHFHWIHLIAVFILGGYFVLSKINLINALTNPNIVYSFFQLYIFGIFFACLFLFIFSHDKFFAFAKEMEREEEKTEKKYLEKYIRHGKVLATFVIGMIGGPIFSSLTARLLLKNYAFKYLLVILANFPSTVITVLASRGLVNIFNF